MWPFVTNLNRFQVMSSTSNSNSPSFATDFVTDEATPVFIAQPVETIPATTTAADNRANSQDDLQNMDVATIFISILVVTGLSLLSYLDSRKQPDSSLLPMALRTSPCKNCRYFHNSGLLKCAVHPTRVLTSEAENCLDCEPGSNH